MGRNNKKGKRRQLDPVVDEVAPPSPSEGPRFPIVGIGASAGGLEAFTQLLKALPVDTGMAFILIQHLDPVHESFLAKALGKTTAMPVQQVESGMEVLPDHVYVIPSTADIDLRGNHLALLARNELPGKLHLPIDSFFRSLARERGSQAIGVVLSGTASDGTDGLRAIKDENGITLVQEPQSAKFSGMPQSAVNAGVVDHQLPLPLLAAELARLSKHPYVSRPAEPLLGAQDAFQQILLAVRNAGCADFTEYKPATIERRLARRMALRRSTSAQDYLKLLRVEPQEIQELQEDVLIHVTSFFRDGEMFEVLKQTILPELLKPRAEEGALRVWVAGCSTGEEVYSLVIALLEFLDGSPSRRPIQFFGTDISEKAIRVARLGIYPEAAVHGMTDEQRRRFFVKVDDGYQVQKVVREMCVFVRHDLARDPPFSKLDLISCRNTLIYFGPDLQKRIIGTFHYCLGQPGYLLLGRTESLVGFGSFFAPLDKQNKIFGRTQMPSTMRFSHPARRQRVSPFSPDRQAGEVHGSAADLSRQVDRLLLSKYAPPGVVVNDALEVLQFRGRTGQYLEAAAGDPQTNLLKMARPGLLSALRAAFAEAKKDGAPSRKDGLRTAADGSTRPCSVLVLPVDGPKDANGPLFAVIFEASHPEHPASKATVKPPAKTRSDAAMSEELASTRDYLQSLIEEHGRTNDDLGSANEELVSSNEELQSMNEELETAKEELQSANEELITVNDELHNTNQQLHKANGDLINLLDTVDVPVVILDLERRIRRFTPKARHLMNVLPADVGRAIDDIKLNIEVSDLDERVAKSIASGSTDESEVRDSDGHWHRMQIRPYKSPDGSIDGALVSLVDIDALKHTVHDAEWSRDYAAGVVDAVQVPLVVLDEQLRALSANEAFYTEFELTPPLTEGKAMADWGSSWDIGELRPLLESLFTRAAGFHGFELERIFPKARKWLSFSARMVDSRVGLRMALLAIEDVTARKRDEAERADLLVHAREVRDEAERANSAKDAFLATLSHELRTPLATMLMQAQMMRRGAMDQERINHISEVMERCTITQSHLIDDLLDTSRIVSGKLKLELENVDIAQIVRTSVESVSGLAARKAITVAVEVERSPGRLMGDRSRLQQIFWNLLGNAIKFTPDQGRVCIKLDQIDGRAVIEVSDTGVGIAPEFLPHVFTRFSQQDNTSSRRHGGLGLGLAIVHHLVELHGGTVVAESAGKGRGSTVRVTLPLQAELQLVPAENAAVPHGAVELRGVRIMLVDDDQQSRATVEQLLEHSGAQVRGVGSAAEARATIEAFAPALIVSDIAMPGEDGYSFIRSVRQSGKSHALVPAVALTALASNEDRQYALSSGFQEHLAKPVDSDRLLRMLSRLARAADEINPSAGA